MKGASSVLARTHHAVPIIDRRRVRGADCVLGSPFITVSSRCVGATLDAIYGIMYNCINAAACLKAMGRFAQPS